MRICQSSVPNSALNPSLPQPVTTHQITSLPTKPALHKSRLQEMALVVDTGGAYRPEEESAANPEP